MTLAVAMTFALPALGMQVVSAQPASAATSDSPEFVCHDPLQPYLYPDPICTIVYAVTAPLCKSGCGVDATVVATRDNA